MKEFINDTISDYISLSPYPWHMPGHKRKAVFSSFWDQLFLHDFTEVPGLDDYHHPEKDGMILNSQLEAEKIYKTYLTRYLVNGSSSGVLTSIYAAYHYSSDIMPDKKLTALCARNCHKSVFNALELLNIEPIYIYPSLDEETGIYSAIKKEDFKKALKEAEEKNLSVAFAILTSPTYEGFFSDIKEISKIKNAIPLIIDEAHGAHLPFITEKKLRESSGLYSGADIVIQSLHKTLPCLTQTAIIHISDSSIIKEDLKKYLIKYLSVFQTTSPSYIFMQSIEKCIAWSDKNRSLFTRYYDMIDDFRFEIENHNFKNFHLFRPEDHFDRSRLVIILDNPYVTGYEFAKILSDEYKLVVEMSANRYITLISTVLDSNKDFDDLLSCLIDCDDILSSYQQKSLKNDSDLDILATYQQKSLDNDLGNDLLLSTRDGYYYLKDAIGKTVDRYIYVYPPGIPIVAPGEIITKAHSDEIINMLASGKKIYQN